jgi:hypothetical protein
MEKNFLICEMLQQKIKIINEINETINIIINNNGPVLWTRKIAAHKLTFWVCAFLGKNHQNL